MVWIREQECEAAENVGTTTQPTAGKKENTNHCVNHLVVLVVKNTTTATAEKDKKKTGK